GLAHEPFGIVLIQNLGIAGEILHESGGHEVLDQFRSLLSVKELLADRCRTPIEILPVGSPEVEYGPSQGQWTASSFDDIPDVRLHPTDLSAKRTRVLLHQRRRRRCNQDFCRGPASSSLTGSALPSSAARGLSM